jgi:hypothetical protein
MISYAQPTYPRRTVTQRSYMGVMQRRYMGPVASKTRVIAPKPIPLLAGLPYETLTS